MRNYISILVLATTLAACKSKPPEQPPATSGPPPAATNNTPATPETHGATAAAAKANAAPDPTDYASYTDEMWCPKAHSDTVKIVEAMKATMKRAGNTHGSDDYAPPEEARYIELCGKLPLAMQQCLVVGYAARNREACQAALNAMDGASKKAYAELMGK